MKHIAAVTILLGLISGHCFGQQAEGEPVKVPDEVLLGGFAGCAVAPPKDGCDARIVCRGVGTLYGNTGMDVQAATEEATMEAKNEVAKFYSAGQKAQQALAKAIEGSAKSTSDGGKAISSSMSRLMTSVSSSSAEAVLSGVQVLGRQIDVKQQAVTVKVGVSCRSQAAAAQSQATSAKSANPGGGKVSASQGGKAANQSAETFRIGPGTLQNSRQQVKNPDDF